jgi:hypothetical protein
MHKTEAENYFGKPIGYFLQIRVDLVSIGDRGLGVMVGFDMDFGTPNKKPPMVPAKNAAPDANQSKENVRRPDRRSDSAVSPYKSSIPQPSATDNRKPLPANVASPKIPLIALRSRDSQEGGRSDVPFSVICLSPNCRHDGSS